MKRYLCGILLVACFQTFGQWSAQMFVNASKVDQGKPFINADTSSQLEFRIVGLPNIPVSEMISPYVVSCSVQSQEQSNQDTLVDLEKLFANAKGIDKLFFEYRIDAVQNMLIIRFRLEDASDCIGQFIWFKFSCKEKFKQVVPQERNFKILINPS